MAYEEVLRMGIWNFYRALTRRLLAWNLANVALGVVLLKKGTPWWRGFGSQNMGWAVINFAIAIFGGRATEKRRAQLLKPDEPVVVRKEAHNLRLVLWVNAVLDVLYMVGGHSLARTLGKKKSSLSGMGWGIVFQGALLLAFDVIHALLVPEQ